MSLSHRLRPDGLFHSRKESCHGGEVSGRYLLVDMLRTSCWMHSWTSCLPSFFPAAALGGTQMLGIPIFFTPPLDMTPSCSAACGGLVPTSLGGPVTDAQQTGSGSAPTVRRPGRRGGNTAVHSCCVVRRGAGCRGCLWDPSRCQRLSVIVRKTLSRVLTQPVPRSVRQL